PGAVQTPGQLVGEEDVRELRAGVGGEERVAALALQVVKVQPACVRLGGGGDHAAGGCRDDEIEDELRQQKGREVVRGEGHLDAVDRELSPRRSGPCVVDQHV